VDSEIGPKGLFPDPFLGGFCFMTTGSKTDDRSHQVENYYILYPSHTKVSQGFGPEGDIVTKTWSGTDYPKTRPTYEIFRAYSRYYGKTFRHKYRTDKPTRRKTEDHPYSCSIRSSSNKQIHSYNLEFNVIIQENFGLPNWGDGYSNTKMTPWTSNDDLALIGKLREAVAGSDFNMGVFLGEGHEALTMITDSATRIYKALKLVKHGNVVGAAAALGDVHASKRHFKPHKDVASNWLQLQYGWLPLLQDVEGGAQFLGKLLNFPLVATYKVRKKKQLNLQPHEAISPPGFTWRGVGNTKTQLTAYLSEVDPYQLSGLLDPLSVAWELLPYSFVCDWFIPIGSYLSARSLASSLTGTFVTTKTTRTDCFVSGLKDNAVPPNYIGQKFLSQPAYRVVTVKVDRTVSTSLQVPVPSIKTLDKVASWKHCANAVALLTNFAR
jgi:hypothetical protein